VLAARIAREPVRRWRPFSRRPPICAGSPATGAEDGTAKGEAQRLGWRFGGLIKMTHRLAAEGRAAGSPTADTLETAQWARASEATVSLAQMAAHSATGSPEPAALVRERQNLVGKLQVVEKRLIRRANIAAVSGARDEGARTPPPSPGSPARTRSPSCQSSPSPSTAVGPQKGHDFRIAPVVWFYA
jgi:hypothetical protein